MSTQQSTFETIPLLPPVELREYLEDGTLRLHLHEGQYEAWISKARFVAIVSGTQGGKTSFAPNWLLREIQLRGHGDYLYAAPSFTLLDKKALPEFKEVFEYRGNFGTFKSSGMKFVFSEEGMRRIHGENTKGKTDKYDPLRPTTVYFGHAQNPESLESATYKAAILDEAGQTTFKLESWEAILRRLAIYTGRVLIATTPYNLGWLYREVYLRWKEGDKDYHVINFASDMNPRFPKAEMERARRTLPDWKYRMFYLGQFTKPAGLIYDCYDERKHERKPFNIPDDWPRVIGVDFGGINTAAVYVAYDPKQPHKLYPYKIYYPKENKTAAQHAIDIMAEEPTVNVDRANLKVSYDKKQFTIIGGSRSEIQWRTEFRAAGLFMHPTFLREIEIGIDRVYGTLKLERLEIFDTLKLLIDEFITYSREVDEETGDVIPGTIVNQHAYHLLDAIRYLLSFIADPTHPDGWQTNAAETLNPDGDLDLDDLLVDEDVDLDDPRVQKMIRRRLGMQKRSKQLKETQRSS